VTRSLPAHQEPRGALEQRALRADHADLPESARADETFDPLRFVLAVLATQLICILAVCAAGLCQAGSEPRATKEDLPAIAHSEARFMIPTERIWRSD
jgi:hypothetical protein